VSDNSLGVGGLTFDKKKRNWPSEVNVFVALLAIIAFFEIFGRLHMGQSFLFNSNPPDTCKDGSWLGNLFSECTFNTIRMQVVMAQVAITGIIAIGVTQVIISGGIDLSSGSVLGAAGMIAMSFAQMGQVNGNPNPTAVFSSDALHDLPVVIPLIAIVVVGIAAGLINGVLIAYVRLQPFIVTLAMMLFGRSVSLWWNTGKPASFPIDSYKLIGSWQWPAITFIVLAAIFHLVMGHTKYGRHCYAIGSNEEAARVSGVNIAGHKMLVYTIAAVLTTIAALVVTSKNLTAQAGFGAQYELDAISMAVIGGTSLMGGRGTIVGTVLGAMILSVVLSGFIFIGLDPTIQGMAKGAIIVIAATIDQIQERRKSARK
jgi:inositol transport system permease protein